MEGLPVVIRVFKTVVLPLYDQSCFEGNSEQAWFFSFAYGGLLQDSLLLNLWLLLQAFMPYADADVEVLWEGVRCLGLVRRLVFSWAFLIQLLDQAKENRVPFGTRFP